MSLRLSYTLLAPFYDLAIRHPLRKARLRSLQALPQAGACCVLINGVGTGLDLPLLPVNHRYVSLDLTAAMLTRARPRGKSLNIAYVQGDSMALPFADESFDHAVLHLILAVVPKPALCLAETARVLKPGGTILVFDKFLRPGESAWLRRALNPLACRIATRFDVVLEELLAATPQLAMESDVPVLASGWFRAVRLVKPAAPTQPSP
jgi:ubiquinone/menaquinone biosynthesis C-methylase UbiE